MNRNTHDYTKASEANAHMYAALHYARREDITNCVAQILAARQLMDEYFASDNMVPSEDIAFGWYRAEEVDNKL